MGGAFDYCIAFIQCILQVVNFLNLEAFRKNYFNKFTQNSRCGMLCSTCSQNYFNKFSKNTPSYSVKKFYPQNTLYKRYNYSKSQFM